MIIIVFIKQTSCFHDEYKLFLYCAVGVKRQSDFGRFKSARFESQVDSPKFEWKQDQRSWYATTVGKFLHLL